eukprot:UN03738
MKMHLNNITMVGTQNVKDSIIQLQLIVEITHTIMIILVMTTLFKLVQNNNMIIINHIINMIILKVLITTVKMVLKIHATPTINLVIQVDSKGVVFVDESSNTIDE